MAVRHGGGRVGRLGFSLVGVVVLAEVGRAEVRYTLTDLGTFLGTGASWATAINNRGEVVGYSGPPTSGITHAFLWSGGVMKDLGVLSGPFSEAADINDAGVVVGTSRYESSYIAASHAFAYYDGAMHDIGGEAITNGAVAISSAGVIVVSGSAWLVSQTGERAGAVPAGAGQVVAMSPSGRYLAGRGDSGPNAVVLLSEGPVVRNLGALGYTNAFPSDVNDAGQVVGALDGPGGRMPYIHDSATGRTTVIPVPGGITYSGASAVNSSGSIVGHHYRGPHNEAFLYEDGVTYGLNSLIDPSSGWNLENAEDINDRGQIVGYGTTPRGFTHAFLLTPVPEPGVVAVFGLLWLGLRGGRWNPRLRSRARGAVRGREEGTGCGPA